MKNSKFNLMAIAAVIIVIIAGSGCDPCPECPTSTTDTLCDTCYCLTPGIQEYHGEDTVWCCTDTFSRPCAPNYERFYTGGAGLEYGYADISIDSLVMTRVHDVPIDYVLTDIYISNSSRVSDDSDPCARLEVLLPVETKFMEFIKLDTKTQNYQFYDGYLRVNLGQLERDPYETTIPGSVPYEKSHRHVRIKTSFTCRGSVNSGIAAFVYSITPDPCLKNNYAYGYYQLDGVTVCNCDTTKVIPLVPTPVCP